MSVSVGRTIQVLVPIAGLFLASFAACSGGDEILGDFTAYGGGAGSASNTGGEGGNTPDGSTEPEPVNPPR